jgi:hypothetical protein
VRCPPASAPGSPHAPPARRRRNLEVVVEHGEGFGSVAVGLVGKPGDPRRAARIAGQGRFAKGCVAVLLQPRRSDGCGPATCPSREAGQCRSLDRKLRDEAAVETARLLRLRGKGRPSGVVRPVRVPPIRLRPAPRSSRTAWPRQLPVQNRRGPIVRRSYAEYRSSRPVQICRLWRCAPPVRDALHPPPTGPRRRRSGPALPARRVEQELGLGLPARPPRNEIDDTAEAEGPYKAEAAPLITSTWPRSVGGICSSRATRSARRRWGAVGEDLG